MDLNVTVTKNQEFFYTCMGDDSGFLARCMLGNTDGEYYSSMDAALDNSSSTDKIKIDINKKVLFDSESNERIEEPDSLSGGRIYTKEDFSVLREILKWVIKNGFAVKRVYVDELKIATIYTDFYAIKIDLDKGYVDTVRDFETVSKTGNLQKYIDNDKEKIDYIDLSYRNKVFYKLKNDLGTSTIFAATNSSTTIKLSTTTIATSTVSH